MTQKAMEEKFGCKILIRGRGSQKDGGVGMGTEDDLDDLHVCVEGDASSVQQAYDELARIMSSPEEAQRLKAEQLASLAAMSNAGGGGAMTVFGGGGGGGGGGGHYGPGTGGGGGGGGGMIRPGLGFGGDDDNEASEVIQVPNNMVGSLIGKGGETIQGIQRSCGCHMQIARENECAPGAETRPVTLKGQLDAIARAKAEINRILEERQQQNQSRGGGGGGGGSYGGGGNEHTISVKVRRVVVVVVQGVRVERERERKLG